MWLTADQHFCHERIIELANRPFSSLQEMNETMINRWNWVVRSGDLVYHLGDFCLGNSVQAQEIFGQLSGQIHVLAYPWHHDKRWLVESMHSKEGPVVLEPPMVVLRIPEIKLDNHALRITLCHYPMARWEASHYGAWHFYGHAHETIPEVRNKSINVGVDAWGFYPVSLEELEERLG